MSISLFEKYKKSHPSWWMFSLKHNAEMIGVNAQVLSRQIKRHYGCTYSQLRVRHGWKCKINDQRINNGGRSKYPAFEKEVDKLKTWIEYDWALDPHKIAKNTGISYNMVLVYYKRYFGKTYQQIQKDRPKKKRATRLKEKLPIVGTISGSLNLNPVAKKITLLKSKLQTKKLFMNERKSRLQNLVCMGELDWWQYMRVLVYKRNLERES